MDHIEETGLEFHELLNQNLFMDCTLYIQVFSYLKLTQSYQGIAVYVCRLVVDLSSEYLVAVKWRGTKACYCGRLQPDLKTFTDFSATHIVNFKRYL